MLVHIHLNINANKYWWKTTLKTKLNHLRQKDKFLNFMAMQIRKPENEGTLFKE